MASGKMQKMNGHGHGATAGEKEVVKSKVSRATSNGMLEVGGAEAILREATRSATKPVVMYRSRATKLIMKIVFSKLCPACAKHARQLERDLARMDGSHPEDARTVRKLVHYLVEFIKETEQVPSNLDTFVEQKWSLDASNMHMEFSRVAYETFKEHINWGRVIMFLGFAVSFAVYLENGAVIGSAESVLEWTCQVIEEDLGQFFTSQQGWEGFGEYLETALTATRKRHFKCRNRSATDGAETEDNGSVWHGAVAAGAVAIGAMAAFTLRQVFS